MGFVGGGTRASRSSIVVIRARLSRRSPCPARWGSRGEASAPPSPARTPPAVVSGPSGGSAFSTDREAALLVGEVDLVVHSPKDLPTATPDGLGLVAAPCPRGRSRRAVRRHADQPAGGRRWAPVRRAATGQDQDARRDAGLRGPGGGRRSAARTGRCDR
ncbi:hypothetical protein [Streptomyces sp. XY431]|uniref:hypothetical protein n=1 Tax=Streptomyces sp. XY431 TaxID=1415562 RepID=UPI0018FEB1F4|nr:hypothetical protein [Streptomyces sp. XY431]